MSKKILVAGGSGDLGYRIVKALRAGNTEVIAPVRAGTKPEKIALLKETGATIIEVNLNDKNALTAACKGVDCLVSALAGLRDVIVDTQSLWLEAALAAQVPRFIPSDYCLDYSELPEGENRNFDLRKEFHNKLVSSGIKHTSIFNGAFADILAYNTPLYNVKDSSVGIWGDRADWPVIFTSKDNVAAYTAEAALDDSAPEKLHIAGFQVTPNQLVALGSSLKGTQFRLLHNGTLDELDRYNRRERVAHPEGENELYPNWQNSQYIHSMFSVKTEKTDNARYSHLKWTGVNDVLSKI